MLIYGNVKNQDKLETIIKTLYKTYGTYYKTHNNPNFSYFYFIKEWEDYLRDYIDIFIENKINCKKLQINSLLLINVSMTKKFILDSIIGYSNYLSGYMVSFLVVAEDNENYFISIFSHDIFVEYKFSELKIKKIQKKKCEILDLHLIVKEAICKYKNNYKNLLKRKLFYLMCAPFDIMYKGNHESALFLSDTEDNLMNKGSIVSRKNIHLILKNHEEKEEKFSIKIFVYDKNNVVCVDNPENETALYKKIYFNKKAIYLFLVEKKKRGVIRIVKTYIDNNKIKNYKKTILRLHEISEIILDKDAEGYIDRVSFIIAIIDNRHIPKIISGYKEMFLNKKIELSFYNDKFDIITKNSSEETVNINTEMYVLILPSYKQYDKNYQLFFVYAKDDKYIIIIFSRIVSVLHQTHVFYFYGSYSYMVYEAEADIVYTTSVPLDVLEPTVVLVDKQPTELFYSYYKLAGGAEELDNKNRDVAIEFYFYLDKIVELFLSFKIIFFYDVSLIYINNIKQETLIKIYDVICKKHFDIFQEENGIFMENLKRRILYLRQLYDFDTKLSILYIIHKRIKNRVYRIICIIGDKESIDKIRINVINKKELNFEYFYFYREKVQAAHRKGIRYDLDFYIIDNSYSKEKINNIRNAILNQISISF